jgi:mannose-1-phosphate guanylyltransferase
LQTMKAVILVGGPGTRLQPLTDNVPKSIVPVLNRPVLEHMITYLRQFGVEDVILTLNYLPDMIQNLFGDGKNYGVRLTYCLEKEPLGTAGAVRNTSDYLKSTFIVLNGDIFTEMDITGMLAHHKENNARATIALTWVDNPSAFGVVETDEKQKVQRFIEKPPPGEETTHWINAGTYILEPEVLEYIPAGRHYMFEKGLFPGLLEAGEYVYGYPYRGYWLDMGTLEKYFSLNMDLLLSKTHSPLTKDYRQDGIYRGESVAVHPSALISAPSVIGSGCRIGKEVRIAGPVTIGRECILEDGASLENTVLWDGVRIGEDSRLRRCIVSSNGVISNRREVTDCVVTPSRTVPLAGNDKRPTDFR